MTLGRLVAHKLPEPPEEAAGLRAMAAQVLEMGPLLPFRMFWDNLSATRSWWPVLVPLLAWIGWRTYRAERAEFLRERVEQQLSGRDQHD